VSAARTKVPAGCPLTRRQFEVLSLLAAGQADAQIAASLHISGIGTHLYNAARKLGVVGRTQALGVMYAAGWLDPVATEFGDERSSPAQSLYLRSFEKLLALRHTDSAALYFAATREMTHHLRGMYYEVEKLPPWEVLGAPRPPAHRSLRRGLGRF
jgi:DNA-binding CsgD family transcriptional regulator